MITVCGRTSQRHRRRLVNAVFVLAEQSQSHNSIFGHNERYGPPRITTIRE